MYSSTLRVGSGLFIDWFMNACTNYDWNQESGVLPATYATQDGRRGIKLRGYPEMPLVASLLYSPISSLLISRSSYRTDR